jgi:hypothetical protein
LRAKPRSDREIGVSIKEGRSGTALLVYRGEGLCDLKRKRLTANQRAELFEAHGGICWRCQLPIDPIKQEWHEGHVGAPHALGGTVVMPEHKECNMADAPKVTKMVAKANRNRAERLGAKEPSAWAKKYAAEKAKGWKPKW